MIKSSGSRTIDDFRSGGSNDFRGHCYLHSPTGKRLFNQNNNLRGFETVDDAKCVQFCFDPSIFT